MFVQCINPPRRRQRMDLRAPFCNMLKTCIHHMCMHRYMHKCMCFTRIFRVCLVFESIPRHQIPLASLGRIYAFKHIRNGPSHTPRMGVYLCMYVCIHVHAHVHVTCAHDMHMMTWCTTPHDMHKPHTNRQERLHLNMQMHLYFLSSISGARRSWTPVEHLFWTPILGVRAGLVPVKNMHIMWCIAHDMHACNTPQHMHRSSKCSRNGCV